MNYEYENENCGCRHTDKMKWVAVFLAFILLFASLAAITVKLYMPDKVIAIVDRRDADTDGQSQTPANQQSQQGQSSQQTQPTQPATDPEEGHGLNIGQTASTGISLRMGAMRVCEPSNAAPSSSPYTAQEVTATVLPASVADKYVTWSLAWASGAALSNKDVSEYVIIDEDSQGELTATLYCIKSFRGSNMILTCTSRQGNKSATATVMFKGAPTSIALGNASNSSTYNLGNTTVNLLVKGTTYNVPISLDNIFHDVGNNFSNFEVTVTGVGSITCGTYVESPRGRGWNNTDTIVDFADVAPTLVTAAVSGSNLVITPTKSAAEYVGSIETHNVEMSGETTTYRDKFISENTDANGDKPYVIVTVRNQTYGCEASYKFYITEQVDSVAMNSATIEF